MNILKKFAARAALALAVLFIMAGACHATEEISAAKAPGKAFAPVTKFSWLEWLRGENKTYPEFTKEGAGKRNFLFNMFKFSAEHQISTDLALNLGVRDVRFVERSPASNAGISQTNFELSLLNLRFEEFLGNKRLKATLGLQESVCKECRVMGLGNWIIGRLWRGVRLTYYDTPAETLDFYNFECKRTDVDPPSQSRGFYYFNEKKGCEIYLMKKVDRAGATGEILKTTRRNIDVNTLGYKQRFDINKKLQARFEIAVQNGNYGPDDHSAHASHAELKYSAGAKNNYVLGLELNEASGDGNPNDGRHGTFDNLYPSNYGKYGYMDYMSWQNMRQLCVSNSVTIGRGVSVKLNLSKFSLKSPSDGWYNSYLASQRRDVTGNSGTDIGSEANLLFSKKIDADTDAEFGTSRFFAGNYIKNTNAAGSRATDVTWTYFQLTRKGAF